MKFKKANITISFSWLFMIIIGTFFLVLAYNILQTYTSNEEIKYQIEVKQAFRSILNNVGQTTGYEENSLEPLLNLFQDSEVEILCEDGLSIMSINGRLDSTNEFLKNYPTFMTEVKESKVPFTYLAVENFRLPFKVTNMLGIVSKKNLIIFDTDSDITEILRKKFGKGSYKEDLNYDEEDFSSLDVSTFEDKIDEENLQTIMFVSDDTESLSLDLADLSVKAYHLQVEDLSGGDFNYGILHYLDYEGEEFEYNFLDFKDDELGLKPVSLITMGVFSNPKTFNCAYEIAIDSTIDVFKFYINKTNYMTNIAEEKAICSGDLVYYDRDSGAFDGSRQTALYEKLKISMEQALNHLESERFNNTGTLYNYIDSIYEDSVTLRDESCEPIY